MRLSTILELLLIFLLIAFAAYGRVIVPEGQGRGIEKKPSAPATSLKQAAESVNKYCTCNEAICNCCRDFHIPLVQLSGPGCASLQYLQEDKLAMQLSIGDNILSSNVVSGKNPKPVCVALPGGFSKFCGKIYSIKREADKHFKACLGLELRSASELEASLRVSCFRFGPDGLKLRPAEPLPPVVAEPANASDDDYDDLFGLGDDDDDDEDDEDDDDDDDDDEQKISPEDNAVSGGKPQAEEEDDDDDDDDILGFGALFDIFGGEDDSDKKKKKKPAATATTTTALPSSFAIPILSLTSTQAPAIGNDLDKKPSTEAAPVHSSSEQQIAAADSDFDANKESDSTDYPQDSTDRSATDRSAEDGTTYSSDIESTEESVAAYDESIKTSPAKLEKTENKLKVKKTSVVHKKKVSVTSQSANAIPSDGAKPQQPIQSNHNNNNNNNDDDDDDDDEYDSNSETEEESEDDDDDDDSDEEETIVDDDDDDDDDDEEEDKHKVDKNESDDKKETEAEKTEEEEEDDDDEDESEEEEDAVLSALVDDDDDDDEDEKKKKKNKNGSESESKNKKKTENKANVNKNDKAQDEDYSYELAELLARKQPESRTVVARKSARQSKVMRF